MTERDALDEAFAALREETAEASKNAAASASTTRSAIVLDATTRRRRSMLARWMLPIAAVLAASTAWAAATGRLQAVLHVSTPAPETPSVVATPAAPAAAATAAAGSSATSLEPLEPAPSSVASVAAAASTTSPSTPPPTSTTTATATATAEEGLYRAAHTAHFVAHDPAAALVAWDAYLAAHPNGRFAPEARYNRALTLLRLGRTAEARSALRPFADGTFGGYRQKEATQLLDATE